MPAISFSAIEILPALLDKSKTQTIRPLFCKNCADKTKLEHLDKTLREILQQPYHMPRLKVGDIVKLYWKMRSKDKFFYREFGTPAPYPDSCPPYEAIRIFGKLLGIVEIIDVFEIDMWYGNDAPLVNGYSLKKSQELAGLDGFKGYKEFFNYFCSHYDLHEPKKFAVYRFKWLE